MSVKRIILLFVLLGGFCSVGFVLAEGLAPVGVFEVTPVMETRPVSHSGDSADDARSGAIRRTLADEAPSEGPACELARDDSGL